MWIHNQVLDIMTLEFISKNYLIYSVQFFREFPTVHRVFETREKGCNSLSYGYSVHPIIKIILQRREGYWLIYTSKA